MTNRTKLTEKLLENPNFLRDELFMIDTTLLLNNVKDATGDDLKYNTLRSWMYNCDFPKPMLHSEGRARGVKGYYPRDFITLISDILKAKKSGVALKKAVTDSLLVYELQNYISMLKYTKLLAEAYMTQSIKDNIESNKSKIIEMIEDDITKNFAEIISGLNEIKVYEESVARRAKNINKEHFLGKHAYMFVNEYLLSEQVVKYHIDTQIRISSGEQLQTAIEILNIINSKNDIGIKGNELHGIIEKKKAKEGDKNVIRI